MFFDTERHTVPIHDMRPLAGALSLDHEGFELLAHETAADLDDDDAVEKVYYPEIEALLRAVTGASRVVIFDDTRRSDAGAGAKNRDGLRGPASRVHVDYTAKSGPQRVMDLLGEDEAAALPNPAPGSSRSTSGGRSAARCSARRWRSPMPPACGPRI